jgi:hypothetical protein
MRAIMIILLALNTCVAAPQVDLKTIIANPQRFDGQEISTRGLAMDTAQNAVLLFPDFATAAKSAADSRPAAYLRGNSKVSFKVEDNRCWFAVTGIVSAQWHGRWGDSACEIKIKSIRKLYREKRVLWPADIGVFFNATSTEVFVESELFDGGSLGTGIPAKKTGDVKIDSPGVITFKDWSASGFPKAVMFTARVQLPSRQPQEPSERNFHFVIHKNRLEAIDPGVRVEKIRDK